MARRKDFLKDPEKYSVDELVTAIEDGIVTLQELQQTGLLSISKRYAINDKLAGSTSRRGAQPSVFNDTPSSGNSIQYKDGWDNPTSSGPTRSEDDGFYFGGQSNNARRSQASRRGRRSRNESTSTLKSVLIVFISVVVLAGIGCLIYSLLLNRKMSADEIYSKYKKSVVLIATGYHFKATVDGQDLSVIMNDPDFDHMSWNNGQLFFNQPCIGTGTGFFVSEDGKIVTCNHVVTDCENYKDSIEFRLRDAFRANQNQLNTIAAIAAFWGEDISSNRWSYLADHVKVEMVVDFIRVAMNDTYLQSLDDMLPCSLIKSSKDKDIDVAVIQLNTKKTPADVTSIVDIPASMKRDKTSKVDFTMGSDIYSIGFPLSLALGQTNIGIEASNHHGSITQECGEYTYGHDINIQHGASGSPVFDSRGRFAGIVNAGVIINGVAQGYNKAIKPEHVARLLNY